MSRHFFGDTAVLLGRSLRHITRSPDTIITTALMPIASCCCSSTCSARDQLRSHSYVSYLMPGILLITIASASRTSDSGSSDMQSGIFERFHSMPIARSSVLWRTC